MQYENVKNTSYALVHTTTKFNNKTDHCFCFKRKNKKVVKKSKPIEIGGYTQKFNLETGEIRNYTHEECNKMESDSKTRSLKVISNLMDANKFNYFITFTFAPDRIERSNCELATNKLLLWLKKMNRNYKDFQYIFIREAHKTKNNHETTELHFHGLCAGLPITKYGLNLTYSGKVCCSWAKSKKKNNKEYYNKIASEEFFNSTKHLHKLKDLDGAKVYNVNSWEWGFTTLTIIFDEERCKSYVKKYLTKSLFGEKCFGNDLSGARRFFYSRNLNKPEIIEETMGEYAYPFDITKNSANLDMQAYLDLADYTKINDKFNHVRVKVFGNDKENLIKNIITETTELNKTVRSNCLDDEQEDSNITKLRNYEQTKEQLIKDYIFNNNKLI